MGKELVIHSAFFYEYGYNIGIFNILQVITVSYQMTQMSALAIVRLLGQIIDFTLRSARSMRNLEILDWNMPDPYRLVVAF